MCVLQLLGRGCPADGRTDEGMAEPHLCPEVDQAGRFGRRDGIDSDSQPVEGPPQQSDVAGWFDGRREQEPARPGGKRLQLADEAVFDAIGDRHHLREAVSARELGGRRSG